MQRPKSWRRTLGTATTCVHDECEEGSFLLTSSKHTGPHRAPKSKMEADIASLARVCACFVPHSVAAIEELCLSEYGLKLVRSVALQSVRN